MFATLVTILRRTLTTVISKCFLLLMSSGKAIAAAKDLGDGATVVYVNENNVESVIFINKYRSDLSLQS